MTASERGGFNTTMQRQAASMMEVGLVIYVCKMNNACEPALVWLQEQLDENPEIELREVWDRAVKLRRTKAELAYETARKREDPGWKPSSDAHTGWSWIAWLCVLLRVPCSNGVYSGMRKVKDGPNADQVSFDEVYARLSEYIHIEF